MAKTSKQRQAEYRDRLAANGKTTITLTVTNNAAKTLRTIADEHGRTSSEVLELGLAAAKLMLNQRGKTADKPEFAASASLATPAPIDPVDTDARIRDAAFIVEP